MKISVELTLMPLHTKFEDSIIDFIKALRNSKFKVMENPLSTQIFGEYNELMPFLNDAIKTSFETLENVVLNMKIVKTDRSDYEPNF